jgi:hypothetical protein
MRISLILVSPITLLSTCLMREGVGNYTVGVVVSGWEEFLSRYKELFRVCLRSVVYEPETRECL